MTPEGWLQIAVFSSVVLVITRPLGGYLYRVFEGQPHPLSRWLGPVERAIYRLCRIDPREEQDWRTYAFALLAFSALGLLVTYGIERLQGVLPGNPQGLPAVPPLLAFNTAVSFATNTNWQSYAGETTMSYLTQMAGLAWHNFISAAAGIAVALALARGITRRASGTGRDTIGNFWVDVVRSIVHVLLPISAAVCLVLAAQGVIQTVSPHLELTTLEGDRQTIALGPVASQEAIKILGTNGGGFFNANSAHPFENPTPLTNLLEMVLIFAIPAALTHTFGRMARDPRQGWALFASMALLFAAGVGSAYWAEASGHPLLRDAGVDQASGNMEGKEVRFGVASSALFATVTTDASCGAVNAMHDSFTPLGGLVPLFNIQLGEVVFGGVGSGLYGMLVMAILAVFLAGLMVGRTPEYLGKKIETREVKLGMLYVLVFPAVILCASAWAAVISYGTAPLGNSGPHGLSEMLYAFSSAAGNNGSAFAGLAADTDFYNVVLGLSMLAGRFWMIVPALAIAGCLAGKKSSPPGPGTFPTNGPMFVLLLVGVVVVVGALTFFPALALGPVVEHFLARSGRVY